MMNRLYGTGSEHPEIDEIFDIPEVEVQEADLPPYLNGVTESEYAIEDDGVEVDDIQIYLDDSADLDSFYHEVAHAVQYDDLDGRELCEEDIEILSMLHEGQAAANADQTSYRDAMMVYEEFVSLVDEGQTPGEALEEIDETYELFTIESEDSEFPVQDYLALDENVDDVEAYVESVYPDEADITVEEIEYDGFDTDGIADHLIDVQETIDTAYRDIEAAGYDLPRAAR